MKYAFWTIALMVLCVATAAEAAPVWVDCTPANVATFNNRVHVKCTASVAGGIQFFAVASSDTANAARFLSLASAALVAGRPVQVFYDPADTSGGAFGCNTGDCRRAQGLAMFR